MRLVDIIICVPVALVLFFSARAMARNVKAGRSIDGCNGDCAHCASSRHAR